MHNLSGELTVIVISLVVAEVRERMAVSKQETRKFEVERFNLRKLNELYVRKQYQMKISNRIAALESFSNSKDINRALENIKEDIKISAKECFGMYKLQQHTPWFDEECLHFLDQRKQAKMQWLHDPNQSTAGNLNNVRHEASRHFRKKIRNILQLKLMNLKLPAK